MKKIAKDSLILILLAFILMSVSCRHREILFYDADGTATILSPVNRASFSGIITVSPEKRTSAYAYYRFSEGTIPTGAVELSADLQNCTHCTLYFGYLTARDFDERGKILDTLAERPMAVLTDITGHLAVSLAVPDESAVGIVVALVMNESLSADNNENIASVYIETAAITEPRLGWEHGSDERLHCAFSAAGGAFNGTSFCYQDNGIALAFRDDSWQLEISVAPPAATAASAEVVTDTHTDCAVFETAGGVNSQLSIIVPPDLYTAIFPKNVFKEMFSSIRCISGGSDVVKAVHFVRTEPPYRGASNFSGDLQPILIDPGLIPSIKMSAWRRHDYELYAWDRFPQVLIFDTAAYDVQSLFFKRLAFFVEKAGYRGTLLTDQEMAGMHGYNAHDYRAESLAEFFTAVHRSHFQLNRYEMMLRDILITRGVINIADDGFIPGVGAIISISKDSSLFLRCQFLVHESLHGLYFTDAEFRRVVHDVYTQMPEYATIFMETYFSAMDSLRYDTEDQYLMENEFMAYIMQQTAEQIPDYFVGKYNRRLKVRNLIPEITSVVAADNAAAFTDAGHKLGLYISERWGLDCGRVHLLECTSR